MLLTTEHQSPVHPCLQPAWFIGKTKHTPLVRETVPAMHQNIITASQASNTACVGPHTHLWTLRVHEYFILSSESTLTSWRSCIRTTQNYSLIVKPWCTQSTQCQYKQFRYTAANQCNMGYSDGDKAGDVYSDHKRRMLSPRLWLVTYTLSSSSKNWDKKEFCQNQKVWEHQLTPSPHSSI